MSDAFVEVTRKWAESVTRELETGIKDSVKAFTDAVIDDTPVDVETPDDLAAVENWRLEIGDDVGGTMKNGPAAGGAESRMAVTSKLEEWKPLEGEKLRFVNNAYGMSFDGKYRFYAMLLEFGLFMSELGYGARTKRTINGYSTQAPMGMVRRNLVEFNRALRAHFGSSLKSFSREM